MQLLPALPLPALIACVDSSEDVLLLLRDRMVDAGYRAVTFASPIRYGPQPVVDFLTYLAPQLAIYTVAPPYRESWAEYQFVRREVPECPLVPVTTHKEALERIVGPTDALEVLAAPADLEVLLAAVQARLAVSVGARDGHAADGKVPTAGRDGHTSTGQRPPRNEDGTAPHGDAPRPI